MSPLEVLIAARARIESRSHWTRQAWARDKRGRAVAPLSPRAVRWCAVGAVYAQSGGGGGAVLLLNRAASTDRLDEVNDGEGGHDAVLALYDKAIEFARAEATS